MLQVFQFGEEKS